MHALALYKRRTQWQLVRCQPHGFLGVRRGHAFHLKQDFAGTDYRDPMIRRALAFSHTSFSRLLGDWLIGEQADPNLSAALHKAGDSDAARFDLTVADPARLQHLQSECPRSEERRVGKECRSRVWPEQ